MKLRKTLEIDAQIYEPTKEVMIKNGVRLSEQFFGNRRVLYSNSKICGFLESDNYLPLSEELSNKEFSNFLASFSLSLSNQLRKKHSLWGVKIEYDGDKSGHNPNAYRKIKQVTKFYQIDLSSAYWQMAFRLGYISKNLFDKYMFEDKYKQAKRYCVSFLGRTNYMRYYDGREIEYVECDTSFQVQVYENIRNEMYQVIKQVRDAIPNWVMYHIDSVSVMEKDFEKAKSILENLSVYYKVKEAVKLDNTEYSVNGKLKKF